MTAPRVVVVGSANVDQVFRVERIPAPGETVLSHGLETSRGGKGQNQAVAAARTGARVSFVGAVGGDDFATMTLDGLVSDGIDTARVRRVGAPTGTALIAVDAAGENSIIVEPGANAKLELDDTDRALIAGADVLLLQLEIPLAAVQAAAEAANGTGTVAILNAAPIAPLPAELLALLDVLVVNEHEEARLRSDTGIDDLTGIVPVVVVTLGGEGAELRVRAGRSIRVPAPPVEVVDSTGAGDAFCGAFAAALGEGMDYEDATRFAVAAGSLSVQHRGAVPSIPVRAAIDNAFRAHP